MMTQERPLPVRVDRIDRVQKIVAALSGLRQAILVSERKKDFISWPRQIAMHICYQAGFGGYEIIGDRFGGRDHTTVMWASKALLRRVEQDHPSKAFYNKCLIAVQEDLGDIGIELVE